MNDRIKLIIIIIKQDISIHFIIILLDNNTFQAIFMIEFLIKENLVFFKKEKVHFILIKFISYYFLEFDISLGKNKYFQIKKKNSFSFIIITKL